MKRLLQIIGYFSLIFCVPIPMWGHDEGQIGRQIFFGKGNCIACHIVEGDPLGGNLGPPLVTLSKRFSIEALREQISDPRIQNSKTVMPPYGAHKILTKDELTSVILYLYSI